MDCDYIEKLPRAYKKAVNQLINRVLFFDLNLPNLILFRKIFEEFTRKYTMIPDLLYFYKR